MTPLAESFQVSFVKKNHPGIYLIHQFKKNIYVKTQHQEYQLCTIRFE